MGFPIPSPAILERIGLRFRKAVAEFATGNDIPVVRLARGERKLEVMRPHLDRLARAGRTGWPRSAWPGVQRVSTGIDTTYYPDAESGVPRFGYAKADGRVTACYTDYITEARMIA